MRKLLFLLCVLVLISPVFALPQPVTDFVANETSVCPYDDIQFTDLSVYSGDPTWWWLFGDSQDSHVENPTHYYDTPGTYTVQLWVQDAWGGDWENKTAYITVRDCYNADFTANRTCNIGIPKGVQLNSTCYGADPDKVSWLINPHPGWSYWNGTHWVIPPTGIFSGVMNPQINFTSYGAYTVTQGCNFGPPVGMVENTKTEYISIGVNGTYCSIGGCGGWNTTDWSIPLVVFAFIPLWLLIAVGVSGKK